MSTLRIAIAAFVALAPAVGMAAECPWNKAAMKYEGSAAEQVRCLLRFVGLAGVVKDAQPVLPGNLEALVGQPIGISRARLREYLKQEGIEEWAVGGNLDAPLSRTESGRVAEYFVIHDTSTPLACATEFPAVTDSANAEGNRPGYWTDSGQSHLFLTRDGQSQVPQRRPFLKPGQSLRRPDGKCANDRIALDPGLTDAQYRRLALVYVAASVRKGSWLVPGFHAVIDLHFPGGHDDPQNFVLAQWVGEVCALRDKLGDTCR